MRLLFERFNKFLNEEDAKILKFGKRSNENRHDMFIDKLEQLVKDYGEEEAQIEISKDNYGQLVVSIFTNLKRGYYHVYVEDEYGCKDSVDYVAYHQGLSSVNTYLGIDASISLDMSVSKTNVICFEDTNATVKLLYPNICYNYELLLYHDTAATQLIATDSIRISDTLVYFDAKICMKLKKHILLQKQC